MNTSVRRLAPVALVAALVVPLSACASDHLRERDAKSVRVGQVLAPSYTASVRGTRSHVMIPSGRVDLTLSRPLDEVPAQDAAGATPLRPTGGAAAVGVSWSLNLGGFPDTANRQLASPKTIFGVPQPVRLRLVTDGTRREIPDVGTLEVPGARARNAAWVVVPAGTRQWRFEVEFAGVTQTVDARTGKTTPGLAAALYRPLPLDRDGVCTIGERYYTSCLTDYAIGYPYVDGGGWAPTGKVFVLLRIVIGSDHDANEARVAGRPASARVAAFGEQFGAYLVTPARTYAVRGTGQADNDAGASVTLPLTGTLTAGGAV